MRLGIIAKYIGNSLLLVAAIMGLSAGVSAYYGFDEGFIPLIYSCAVTAILGAFPNIFVRNGHRLSRSEGYCIVVGSWVFSCLLGMIPYLMYGGVFTFANALFESISGFTTTGASILTDIEALPRGILFWRMSTAWIGGIGIIALFSLVVPSSQNCDTTLNTVEMSSLARKVDGLRPRTFTHKTILVYIVLTVIAIFSLKGVGMGWFDAVTHAMSACSTCGFSTKNNSIAGFGSVSVEMVLVVFMLVSSLRFSLLSRAFMRRKSHFLVLTSEAPKAFLSSIAVAVVVLTAGLFFRGDFGSLLECARVALFHVASIFSTTGFATVDTNLWPSMCAAILIMGSLVCGCSGSTSGGIKMDRAVVAWKSLKHIVQGQRQPNLVSNIVVDGKEIKAGTCSEVLMFIICYMFAILLGAVLLTVAGLDLKTAGTASVACMGNVGPGLGTIGTMGNYSELPHAVKYVLMALMLFGRLEIFPVIFVFKSLQSRNSLQDRRKRLSAERAGSRQVQPGCRGGYARGV